MDSARPQPVNEQGRLSQVREPPRIPNRPPQISGTALPSQPHLSHDLVSLPASLPTPHSHLELSSLGLQSLQTPQGRVVLIWLAVEGLEPSSAPPGAEGWPGMALLGTIRHILPLAVSKACLLYIWLPHQLFYPLDSLLSYWTYPNPRPHCCFKYAAAGFLVCNIFFHSPLQLLFWVTALHLVVLPPPFQPPPSSSNCTLYNLHRLSVHRVSLYTLFFL